MATSALQSGQIDTVATSRAAWKAEKKNPDRTPESVDKMHRAWVIAAEDREEAEFEKWKKILPESYSPESNEFQFKTLEATFKSNLEAIEMVQISKQKKWENPETTRLYNYKYQDLKNLSIHKEKMAVGVALSVIITVAAITAIALVMIFCPPAGLSALALGVTFGILGGASTLGLLGITHFSTRLHKAKFEIKMHRVKTLLNKDFNYLKAYYINMKLIKKIKKQLQRHQIAEAIVAPWVLYTRKHKDMVQ